MDKSVILNCKVDPAFRERLREIAAEEGVTLSDIMRQALILTHFSDNAGVELEMYEAKALSKAVAKNVTALMFFVIKKALPEMVELATQFAKANRDGSFTSVQEQELLKVVASKTNTHLDRWGERLEDE